MTIALILIGGWIAVALVVFAAIRVGARKEQAQREAYGDGVNSDDGGHKNG